MLRKLAPILSGAPAHDPQAGGLQEAGELVLDTADGERVIVCHVPPRKKAAHLSLFPR
jgi:hypothetical protein